MLWVFLSLKDILEWELKGVLRSLLQAGQGKLSTRCPSRHHPVLYIFGLWLTLAVVCCESQSLGSEGGKAGRFFLLCILLIPFCFWTKGNQIIGNSLLLTLIHGTYLISLLESEECCPNMIYCPHFSLNLYLKLLMRDLTKLRHWGCLTINYKFPLLGVSVCWQLMKLPVLQDTTWCRKVELSGFRPVYGATDAVPFLL